VNLHGFYYAGFDAWEGIRGLDGGRTVLQSWSIKTTAFMGHHPMTNLLQTLCLPHIKRLLCRSEEFLKRLKDITAYTD
jgi:hypothetical protein